MMGFYIKLNIFIDENNSCYMECKVLCDDYLSLFCLIFLSSASPSFNRQPELLTKSPEIVRAIVGGSLKLQCAFGGK